jgi:cell division septum initiation protein DivIVA
MNRSTTAREALVTELIGDVQDLLERTESLTARVESLTTQVQSLPNAIDQARFDMQEATCMLTSRLEPFRQRLAAEVEQTKHIAVKSFISQTNQYTAEEQRRLCHGMTLAARSVLEKELEPRVRQFGETLQRLVDKADRPWEAWVLRAATVGVTAAVSSGLSLYLFGR